MSRRTFTRDFKVGLLRELEVGKSVAEVSRVHGVHPSLLCKWKREYMSNPETAFAGRGNVCKPEAKVAEYERLVGKLYAENRFLKKALTALEAMLAEHRNGVK